MCLSSGSSIKKPFAGCFSLSLHAHIPVERPRSKLRGRGGRSFPERMPACRTPRSSALVLPQTYSTHLRSHGSPGTCDVSCPVPYLSSHIPFCSASRRRLNEMFMLIIVSQALASLRTRSFQGYLCLVSEELQTLRRVPQTDAASRRRESCSL